MKKEFNRHIVYLCILVFIGTILVVYPFFKHGVTGDMSDFRYHLLRIEGVKNAILQGEYPPKIYEFFFDGYGYGSPMFYSDIFLIFPAIIRMLGFSPMATYKISLAFFTVVLMLTTYFSLYYITKKELPSFVGTGLIVFSQYYLTDLHLRDGYSSFISYIFVPILFAAIYDFIVFEGKKVYLFGVAFCGMLLTHTIMTFLAAVVTIIVFICMLFVSKYRKRLFERIVSLIVVAVISVCLCLYYLLPLVEQTIWGEFNFEHPWASIGDYTMAVRVILFTVKGYFHHGAFIGVGIPILISMCVAFIPMFMKMNRKELTAFFYFLGVFLFASMTNRLIHWNLLNDTIFNMLQFTYRIYPFAIVSAVIGMALLFSEYEFKNQKLRVAMGIAVFVLSAVFAVVQNQTVEIKEESLSFTAEYIESHNNQVGKGEWFPYKIDDAVVANWSTKKVLDAEGNEYDWIHNGYSSYSFDIKDGAVESYRVPIIAYKGYEARLESEGSEKTILPTHTALGILWVDNPDMNTGHVTVEYVGTPVQTVSGIISLITAILLVAYIVYRLFGGRVCFATSVDRN